MRFQESLAKGAVAITPSDTTAFKPTIGLYVGTAGDVKVTLLNGNEVTFKNLGAGAIHPISVSKVFVTGTTATDILAVY